MVSKAEPLGENRYRERFGRYFEDFKQGDIYEHRPNRTLTETDNTWFTLLTMNTHPMHFDAEYAKIINQAIVDKAEEFINNINNDLAKSKLTFAKGEHEIVEQKLQQAKTEILSFQSKYNVLDPSAEGAAFQQIAFSLQATLAQKKAELSTKVRDVFQVIPTILIGHPAE